MDKVKIRNMKLSDYDVSVAKYNELKYFCIQYDEKKKELANSYGISAVSMDSMPRMRAFGRPTEERAVKNVMLENDIKLIEETAKEASAELYSWLMKSITEEIPYEWMDVPAGRRQFYESRRYFFYLLAQKR